MTATFYVGDAIQVMNTLPEKSVDLVLSSPPFLALRSYLPTDHPDKPLEGGSQATPGAYVDWLIDVVEACDRLLAPHGSLIFELGDTYAASPNQRYPDNDGNLDKSRWLKGNRDDGAARPASGGGTGWPADKSLTLIPELFRLSLVYGHNPLTGRQTRRWRLRNVIRWVRPNPPVGALGDKFRPATSELMVFCRTDEAGRKRFFDLDAVRDIGSVQRNEGRPQVPSTRASTGHLVGTRNTWDAPNPAGAPPLDWWEINGPTPRVVWWCVEHQIPTMNNKACALSFGDDLNEAPCRLIESYLSPTRDNGIPLDWWNIPPGGFSGAHYAVWPPELLVKPIKAMCPEKICRQCGEPSRRIVKTSYIGATSGRPYEPHVWASGIGDGQAAHSHKKPDEGARVVNDTLGFSDCSHDNWRPGVVLDPFGGSGTTAAVATGHGRDCILIDLDARNYDLALNRVGPLVLERGEVTEPAPPIS
jgi:site-specific DNA-methyltransferase (adenine-specific)